MPQACPLTRKHNFSLNIWRRITIRTTINNTCLIWRINKRLKSNRKIWIEWCKASRIEMLICWISTGCRIIKATTMSTLIHISNKGHILCHLIIKNTLILIRLIILIRFLLVVLVAGCIEKRNNSIIEH